jgi:hypothetical protein
LYVDSAASEACWKYDDDDEGVCDVIGTVVELPPTSLAELINRLFGSFAVVVVLLCS